MKRNRILSPNRSRSWTRSWTRSRSPSCRLPRTWTPVDGTRKTSVRGVRRNGRGRVRVADAGRGHSRSRGEARTQQKYPRTLKLWCEMHLRRSVRPHSCDRRVVGARSVIRGMGDAPWCPKFSLGASQPAECVCSVPPKEGARARSGDALKPLAVFWRLIFSKSRVNRILRHVRHIILTQLT